VLARRAQEVSGAAGKKDRDGRPPPQQRTPFESDPRENKRDDRRKRDESGRPRHFVEHWGDEWEPAGQRGAHSGSGEDNE
jgi:hypothetical protein